MKMKNASLISDLSFRLIPSLFCLTSFVSAHAAISKIEPIVLEHAVVAPMLNQGAFEAPQAYWVFSGLVSNETGDQYHYFFQMRHDNDQFSADAVLVNAQTNTLILHETGEAMIKNIDSMQWDMGRIFLRFNTINNSWVFGVKKDNNTGFNFKIDMMSQSGSNVAKEQALSTGLEFMIGQTGSLNGHVQIEGQEEFVTAKKAWIRQMWVSKPQQTTHPFTTVLCDFKDGAGFYSVNMQGHDVLRGALAGWRNDAGVALPMSQFVSVKKEKDGDWHIQVPFPKLALSLKDSLPKTENDTMHLAAGEISGKSPGYCVITQNALG